jgi:hypothetical protein
VPCGRRHVHGFIKAFPKRLDDFEFLRWRQSAQFGGEGG